MEIIVGIAFIIIVGRIIVSVFSKSDSKGGMTEDEKFDFFNKNK